MDDTIHFDTDTEKGGGEGPSLGHRDYKHYEQRNGSERENEWSVEAEAAIGRGRETRRRRRSEGSLGHEKRPQMIR